MHGWYRKSQRVAQGAIDLTGSLDTPSSHWESACRGDLHRGHSHQLPISKMLSSTTHTPAGRLAMP